MHRHSSNTESIPDSDNMSSYDLLSLVRQIDALVLLPPYLSWEFLLVCQRSRFSLFPGCVCVCVSVFLSYPPSFPLYISPRNIKQYMDLHWEKLLKCASEVTMYCSSWWQSDLTAFTQLVIFLKVANCCCSCLLHQLKTDFLVLKHTVRSSLIGLSLNSAHIYK